MKADHGFKFMPEKNIPHRPTYLPEHNLANLKASAILFFWDRSMKGASPLFCSCQLILPLGTTPPYYPPRPPPRSTGASGYRESSHTSSVYPARLHVCDFSRTYSIIGGLHSVLSTAAPPHPQRPFVEEEENSILFT